VALGAPTAAGGASGAGGVPLAPAGASEGPDEDVLSDEQVSFWRTAFGVVGSLIGVACMIVFPCAYKARVTDARPPYPPQDAIPVHLSAAPMVGAPGDFRSNLSSPCADVGVLCHTLCCPAVRIADTYAAAGVMSFWCACFAWLGCWVVAGFACMLWNGQFDDGTQLRDETSLLVALLTGCALQALAFAPRRQYLRVRNGGLHGDFATDFIVWACCAPCAASQEARQVDSVQGVEVRCCCRLEPSLGAGLASGYAGMSMLGPAGVVGPPVQAGGYSGMQTPSYMAGGPGYYR